MRIRLILIAFILLCLPFISKADKIEKAFESLKEFNYFDAKAKFQKKIKKVNSPCAFGLATIYYRQDNPFHQIDSAYKYVRLAETTFPLVSEKQKLRYVEYGFTLQGIQALKQQISTFYFHRLSPQNSVEEWNQFANRNTEAKEYPVAIRMRDSIAYEAAAQLNTSKEFDQYMRTYPQSALFEEAQNAFYLAQYKEETIAGTISAYQTFIANFPKNTFVGQAQDQVYQMATEKNTVEALNDFITKNPFNRNRDEAWRRLYQVYMYEYSDDRIEEFEKEFPQYPFKNEIKSDLKMARTLLVPVRVNDKFGAMNMEGEIVIPAEYDVLSTFNEGLALVGNKKKYGYINKINELSIPMLYDAGLDFEQGRAVVEKNGKYGLIDRSGKLILPCEFDDIGTFSEGLIYAQKNGLYGYYDKFGTEQIKSKFNDVFSFSKGKANVQVGENQAIINTEGEFVFPPKFNSLKPFSASLIIFEEDDYYGLIDFKMNVALPAEYDEIGLLSNGLAILNLDGKIGYIDSLGQIKIEPKYEIYPNYLENAQFKNNLAVVKLKDKFGLIDKSGKFVIQNTYSRLGENSNLIAFNKGKLWGFIDQKNKMVIKPAFDWAESFQNQTAIVAKFDQQGVINAAGNEIIPIDFDEITRMDATRFLVVKDYLSGLYSIDGKLIAPAVYNEIRQLNDSFYVLIAAERIDYLYLPENKMVRQK
ncbi:MAG: WG repeat-containing protein [Crocinitomicaceae bacterium]